MKYLFIAITSFVFLVSCNPKTTEIIEVSSTPNDNSNTGDIPKVDIAEGKVVFLTSCIDCHYGRTTANAQSVVDSYTKEQWDEILPEMIDKAELDEEKSRQVGAYIYWEIEN